MNELSPEAASLSVMAESHPIPIRIFLQLLLVKAQEFFPATAHHEYLPYRSTTKEIAELAKALDPEEIIVHVEPPDGTKYAHWRVYSAAWWREDQRRLNQLNDQWDKIRAASQYRNEKVAELYYALCAKRGVPTLELMRKAYVAEAAHMVLYGNRELAHMLYEVDLFDISPDVIAPKFRWLDDVTEVFEPLWKID